MDKTVEVLAIPYPESAIAMGDGHGVREARPLQKVSATETLDARDKLLESRMNGFTLTGGRRPPVRTRSTLKVDSKFGHRMPPFLGFYLSRQNKSG